MPSTFSRRRYYFSETLNLSSADSNVKWAAYQGEEVILSGGKKLDLTWKAYNGSQKVFIASVNPSDVLSLAEAAHLAKPPPPPPSPSGPHDFGPPPAKWNTLHVNGVRQIRARYPNGNPQDGSGICFSKANHPGEACDGYVPTPDHDHAP